MQGWTKRGLITDWTVSRAYEEIVESGLDNSWIFNDVDYVTE